MSTVPRTLEARGRSLSLGSLDVATVAYVGIAVLAFVVAAGLVFLELATPIGLYGVTQFDDAVYFSAALHLLSGALPYRDFVMVQPPGITVVMAPVAALGRIFGASDGLAIARVVTGVVAGVNAVGVVVLLRRYGLVPALFGGLSFAVFPPAYNADHTLMLEPYLVLFCLLAAWLAFPADAPAGRWRLLAAGVSLGVAGSIKLWAIFPLLAMLAAICTSGWRRATRLLIGATVGAVAVSGVFFVAAPSSFIRDIVTSQLARTTAHPTPILTRLWSIVGLDQSAGSLVLGKSHTTIIAVSAFVIVMLVAGSLVPSIFRKGTPFEWFILGAVTLSVAALFVPEQYFAHYAYFTAPLIAIGLGIGLSRVIGVIQAIAGPLSPTRQRQILSGLAVVLVVTLAAGTALTIISEHRVDVQTLGIFGDPGARVAAEIPPGACVVSDAEALLISGNRALSTRPNCPVVVDSTGTWISFVPAHPPAARGVEVSDPQLVAYWASILQRVDYVVLSSGISFRIPWTPALHAELAKHFHKLPGYAPLIYKADRLGT